MTEISTKDKTFFKKKQNEKVDEDERSNQMNLIKEMKRRQKKNNETWCKRERENKKSYIAIN